LNICLNSENIPAFAGQAIMHFKTNFIMKKNIFIIFVMVAAITFSACKRKNTTVGGEEVAIDQTGNAVCIWDKVPLKETPANDGKWMASISLGEKCNYLDEEKEVTVGEKKIKYLKVELQDGKQGWAQADFIVVDGKPGAILQDAVIYSRPDLLTKTGKSFSKMDIVAIKGEQNEFVEIVGKRKEGKWIESGWVKPANITSSEIDVAVAKYASKALAMEDNAKRIEAVNEIVGNSDLQESVFIDELRSMLVPVDEAVEEIIKEDMAVDSIREIQ
jgi:hypothetical protein